MDTKGIISGSRHTMGARLLDGSEKCFQCGLEPGVVKLNLDGIWFELCESCRQQIIDLLLWSEREYYKVCKTHTTRQPDCIKCDMV